ERLVDLGVGAEDIERLRPAFAGLLEVLAQECREAGCARGSVGLLLAEEGKHRNSLRYARNPMMAPNRVRIIGGDWRSRVIAFPGAAQLRPTPDRVRETLFNWLG